MLTSKIHLDIFTLLKHSTHPARVISRNLTEGQSHSYPRWPINLRPIQEISWILPKSLYLRSNRNWVCYSSRMRMSNWMILYMTTQMRRRIVIILNLKYPRIRNHHSHLDRGNISTLNTIEQDLPLSVKISLLPRLAINPISVQPKHTHLQVSDLDAWTCQTL